MKILPEKLLSSILFMIACIWLSHIDDSQSFHFLFFRV